MPRAAHIEPHCKIWLLLDGSTMFGDGKALLLQLIDDLGSIQRAAERMRISYRRAWGFLQQVEDASRMKLVERRPGGRTAGGSHLTPAGRTFLRRYWAFRNAAHAEVMSCFATTYRRRRRTGD